MNVNWLLGGVKSQKSPSSRLKVEVDVGKTRAVTRSIQNIAGKSVI